MNVRRAVATLVACAACFAFVAATPVSAIAAGNDATWQFAPAQAPPAPEGAEPAPYAVQVGEVGQISFWAPNRGLLITAGNKLVPMGLYAYDGESWHQLSKVCGGSDGRIAWAGPDEFWTIANQRAGQVLPAGGEGALEDVSLCRFKEGAVVASYAMPLEQPDSYEPMDAAECDSATDCWFGGQLDDEGAFHLHWNGTELTVVNAPQDHAIAAMTLFGGVIYESVQLANGDKYTTEDEAGHSVPVHPVLMHTIAPDDPSEYFHDVKPTVKDGEVSVSLPEYDKTEGKSVAPVTLAGLELSSDWSLAGANPATPQLWAVAGYDGTTPEKPQEEGEGRAHPIALRYSDDKWTQVVPSLTSFGEGEEPEGVAAEPPESGSPSSEGAAWVMMQSEDEEAHVERVQVDEVEVKGQITNTAQVTESDVLGRGQDVGPLGSAHAIACPAAHECWLATNQGWLFHLTDGAALPKDTDPFFDGQDGVIEYRPPDDGEPQSISFAQPEDDSLANQQPPTPRVTQTTSETKKNTKAKAKALVKDVHSHLLHGDVLQLSFKLTAKAHVQLLAKRHHQTVAKTARKTLATGAHTLKLHLNPKRWPTKLDLRAKALGKRGAPAAKSTEEPETFTTS